jgi:hypothetical protein
VRKPHTVLLCAAGLALSAGCGRVETVVGAELTDAPVSSLYLEAESGLLAGGFTIQVDPNASGGKYILPPSTASLYAPGTASAEYTFAVGLSGTYLFWGRIRGPGAENNTFWLSVDDGPFYQWRLSTGVIWYWGAITSGTDYGHPIPFLLAAGSHRLTFRNSATEVGLDRLYITALGDVPPGNDTKCDPPNSIQLADGGCEPSCGSHGNTTCGTTACAGQTPLVAYDCDICCHIPPAGADAGDASAADAPDGDAAGDGADVRTPDASSD